MATWTREGKYHRLTAGDWMFVVTRYDVSTYVIEGFADGQPDVYDERPTLLEAKRAAQMLAAQKNEA